MFTDDIEQLIDAAQQANRREARAEAETACRAALATLDKRNKSPSLSPNARLQLDMLRCRTLGQLVQSMSHRGMHREALPVAEEFLHVAERTGNEAKRASALYELACLYGGLDRDEEARTYFERSLAIHEYLGDVVNTARVRGAMGDHAIFLHRYDEAIASLKQAQSEFESVGDQQGAVNCIHCIGKALTMMGRHSEALQYATRALELQSTVEGNKGNVAAIVSTIGMIHSQQSDYPAALEMMQRVVELQTELGDTAGRAIVMGNIGATYRALGDLPRALDCFHRSHALARETGLKVHEAITVGNIGEVYRGMERFDEALLYFYKAQAECEDLHARRPLGYWLRGIGDALAALGRYDEALDYLQRALILRRDELNIDDDLAQTLSHIGDVLGKLGRVDEGLERTYEALAHAERNNISKDASEAHRVLSELHEKRGEIGAALEHWKLHFELITKVTGAETQRKVDALNTRLAVQESQREAERNKAKAEQLEMEIARQKQDLANKALQLVQQSEILRGFRVELEGIIANANTAEQAIHVVQKKLRDLPVNVMNWNKFVGEFRAVHPEFEQQLKEKYSALSKVEIKVCCLLRIGMATREIATILFLSERTIEGHRMRIRKKMNVKTSDDLGTLLGGI